MGLLGIISLLILLLGMFAGVTNIQGVHGNLSFFTILLWIWIGITMFTAFAIIEKLFSNKNSQRNE
ncbi:hypothetical protein CXF81_06325 [Glaciecola sp. 33A]|nr:hypothetical protein CXF81_06325 [Glaciecola sp. 33A]